MSQVLGFTVTKTRERPDPPGLRTPTANVEILMLVSPTVRVPLNITEVKGNIFIARETRGGRYRHFLTADYRSTWTYP